MCNVVVRVIGYLACTIMSIQIDRGPDQILNKKCCEVIIKVKKDYESVTYKTKHHQQTESNEPKIGIEKKLANRQEEKEGKKMKIVKS